MAQPEHKLQVAVREFLMIALPPSIEWTANAAGVHVTMQTANKMKAAGVRRGWPDLQFLFPDGVTRYIELKAGASLSTEQKAFRDRCAKLRPDMWALCRSIDDVSAVLKSWGAPLRATTWALPATPIAREGFATP